MSGKLGFYRDSSNKWRWRLKADNGRIICSSSQGYVSKQGAWENANLVSDELSTAIAQIVWSKK